MSNLNIHNDNNQINNLDQCIKEVDEWGSSHFDVLDKVNEGGE